MTYTLEKLNGMVEEAKKRGGSLWLRGLTSKHLKEKHTIREALELTKGQFGSKIFAQFFNY